MGKATLFLAYWDRNVNSSCLFFKRHTVIRMKFDFLESEESSEEEESGSDDEDGEEDEDEDTSFFGDSDSSDESDETESETEYIQHEVIITYVNYS